MGCNDQALGHSYTGTGILGLGFGNFSIVEKLGSKFSFCIGRIREHGSTHNLILGDGANIQGNPTMISISRGHYMFQLESILVGEKITLDYPLQVYLDTGSTISHLSEGLYKDIVDKVKNIIGVEPLRGESLPQKSLLCYAIDASKIPEDIDIGFIFEGGAELSVDVRSLFILLKQGTLCLAIDENPEEDDEIIIGAAALQGYNIGYDIKAKMVYLQKQNCNM
ncbi:PREDICTED: aspartyl protease UND-like [Camelina sativa]|uniref:Aspartyl protease UND-like n=1 Tax=Camelina sativa TaxID=90675 RepID=A0ABM0URM5_CAMSA|nr:PREDICTED: aspartyl protease UND-like [Camelina sativa]